MRSPGRALLLALALVLGAGCVGKGDDAPSAVPDVVQQLAGPSDEELARLPGVLRGTVRSAGFEPVPNATLELPRLSLRASSDAAGAFRIEGVPTGEHLLTIQAEGYHTRSVTVQGRNGTTLDLDVVLEAAPVTAPYVETRELRGFMACAAIVGPERPDCASADPNHRDVFEFELGADGLGAVLELAWDVASTPGATSMTLFVETVGYGAQDIDLGNATGEGYARIEVPRAVMEKYYPEGGLMRARVALAEGAAPAAVTAQASFTVYVSVFYHQDAPAGFAIAQP